METSTTQPQPQIENLLFAMHTQFANSVNEFREQVCIECKWSVPTFYRKMRGENILTRHGSIISAISNAEKDMIRSLYRVELHRLDEWFIKNVGKSFQ